MRLLLDVRNDKHYTGATKVDVVLATGRVVIDTVARCAVIDGKPDSVTFGPDYQGDELIREIAGRAMQLMVRDYGFLLFNSDQ